MQKNNDVRITIIAGTIAIASSLFIVTITMTSLHAYALSRYDIDSADSGSESDPDKEKTDRQLRQEDFGNTAQSPPNIPTVPP